MYPRMSLPAIKAMPDTPGGSRSACGALVWAFLLLAAASALAAPPANFAVEDVVTGLEQPMAVRFLPDGRMLLIQKKGHVRIVDVSGSPIQSALYMDLNDPAHTDGLISNQERGVLDLAIDPNFPADPYIYLFYTPASGPNGPRARIGRFAHFENAGGVTSRGNPVSEVILWEDSHGYDSCCHFGGGLDFGPDGHLWLTMGEHFQSTHSMSLEAAGGKVHRIAKDGTIPPGNPFDDGAGPLVDSLFGYGLRNPFRARWDLPTGQLFIAEVGGNTQSEAWEDLHLIRYDDATGRFVDSDFGTASDNGIFDGINYGWPTVEGPPPHTSFPGANIDPAGEPVFAYEHDGDFAAITGGVVYRNALFPEEYQGAYFYADSTRDFIRYLKLNPDGSIAPNPAPDPISVENPDPVSHPFDLFPVGRIVALEAGPDGALYFVSYADSGATILEWDPVTPGAVRRYVYDSGNVRPVISDFSAAPSSGPSPLPVDFTLEGSDPESDPMTYVLHFGDGNSTAPSPLPQNSPIVVPHTYATDGVFTARLEVSDAAKTASRTVNVRAGTPPVITSFTSSNAFAPSPGRTDPSNTSFRFGDTFTFTATATDAEDGALTGQGFTWAIAFIRPGNTHPALGPDSGMTSIDFSIPAQGQGFSGPVFYRCFLTVTDSSGLTASSTLDIHPEKANIFFNTIPSGILVQINGNTAKETPFILDTLINLNHVITVPETDCVLGTQHDFAIWSNGPTTTQQNFVMPDTDTTLTAVYSGGDPCPGPPAAGLVMHLEANAGLVLSGSSVLSWEDQTGNLNHLSAAGNPVLLNAELAGYDVIHFDGVDDALLRTGFTGLPTGSSGRSVFMVARYNETTASPGWAGFAYGTPLLNQAFGLTLTPSGILGVQGWGSGNDFESFPPTNGVGQWLTHAAICGGGITSQYKDGRPIGSAPRSYNTGTAGISLAAEIGGGSNQDMDVAEILVYDRAVTEIERRQIEDYFERRYLISTGGRFLPYVSITSPAPNDSFTPADMPITLTGVANDIEDGDISHSIAWNSSIDGALGAGASRDVTLSPGSHVISVTAEDSSGLQDTADIRITVGEGGMLDLVTSGLVLHLESDSSVTLAGGSAVAGWQDQSGLGNDLAAGGNPQLAAALTPAGQPAIRLDGTGDRLERIHATDPIQGLPAGNADRTIFVVERYNDANAWAGTSYGTGAFNQAFGLAVSQPAGKLVLQGWGSDLVSTAQGTGAGWLVQSAVHDNGTATHYKDGVPIGQIGQTYETALSKLVIGEEISGLGFVDMDVAAVLIYDRALNEIEHESTGNFLENKYLVVNAAPSVNISAPVDGLSFGQIAPVVFTASANDTEDGDLSASIIWSSGLDGSFGAGASISTALLSPGTHTVTASVTDSGGLTGFAVVTVTVVSSNGPNLSIDAPSNGANYEQGESVSLIATATDAEDGDLSASIIWNSNPDGMIGSGASILVSTLSPGTHTITASVTDSDDLTGTDSIQITINAIIFPPSLTGVALTTTSGSEFDTGDLKVNYTPAGSTATVATAWKVNGAAVMMLYLPMEGGEPAALSDYSGNGAAPATKSGDPAWSATAGHDGNGAYIFDGDDYLDAGEIFPAVSSYTKTAWVYRTGAGGNIISGDTDPSGHAFWAPQGIPGFTSNVLQAGHNGVWNAVEDAVPLGLNTWYFVAVTWDAISHQMVLYKNGLQVDSAIVSTPVGDATALVGAFNGIVTWTGKIDDVRIYSRALTQEQIAALYALGAGDANTIVAAETLPGEQWTAQVSPFSSDAAGAMQESNTLIVVMAGQVILGLKVEVLDNPTNDTRITFRSVAGLDYTILTATDLGAWTALATIPGNDLEIQFDHTGGGGDHKRFYFVSVTTSP